MKYALSWKSFAKSIQSCQRHILLGARVIKGIFCHVQGLFNIVKGVARSIVVKAAADEKHAMSESVKTATAQNINQI